MLKTKVWRQLDYLLLLSVAALVGYGLMMVHSATCSPDCERFFPPTSWATRQAQYDAVCTWGIPNHTLLERVVAIDRPVFVANGDRDPMILPRYSYLLAGLLPNARVTIYPDSAHGFLFQHHDEFAADVHAFLDRNR